uniref:Uncharacterized protein n=1 Tax=Arundo donax TaxID=35708 RepID=A0A0A8Z3D3_ARUDO
MIHYNTFSWRKYPNSPEYLICHPCANSYLLAILYLA